MYSIFLSWKQKVEIMAMVPHSKNPWMEYCVNSWFAYKENDDDGCLDLASYHKQEKFEKRFRVTYRALFNYVREDKSKRFPLYKFSFRGLSEMNYHTHATDTGPTAPNITDADCGVDILPVTIGTSAKPELATVGKLSKSNIPPKPEQKNPMLTRTETYLMYKYCTDFNQCLMYHRFGHSTRIGHELKQLMKELEEKHPNPRQRKPAHTIFDLPLIKVGTRCPLQQYHATLSDRIRMQAENERAFLEGAWNHYC